MPRVSRYSWGLIGPSVMAVLDHEFGVVGDGVLTLYRVLRAKHQRVAFADDEALGRSRNVGTLVAALSPGNDLAGFHHVTRSGEELGSGRKAQVGVVLLAAGDLDPRAGVASDDFDDAVDVADLGLALGDATFEELLDARQAGGDVQAGDAAGVERSHRQLRARLADRLGGDYADRFTDTDQMAGGQVTAVAHPADAVTSVAGEWRPDEDFVNRRRGDGIGDGLGDLTVALDDRLARIRV